MYIDIAVQLLKAAMNQISILICTEFYKSTHISSARLTSNLLAVGVWLQKFHTTKVIMRIYETILLIVVSSLRHGDTSGVLYLTFYVLP